MHDLSENWLEGNYIFNLIRLPGTWLPDNYKLQLVPNFAPAFTIDGLVKATLVSTSDSSEIFLHAKAMTVFEDGVDVRGSNWSSVSIAGFGYDDKRDFFIVYLADSAPANTRLTVAIPYEGQLSDNLSGFYRSSYERDGETHWLAITQFEATDARKAFPCMDEPAMKAVFWVTLGRPQLYSTASNMPIELAGLQLDPPKDGYVKASLIFILSLVFSQLI
jgi:aminopeptidase N